MSLDAFIDKVNTLISEGRFAGIGVPQVRVEGTTAWGAWLRINHRHSAYGRRPQLLCGVLFHAANRRITFHGDASCTTHHVLPLFESWTREQIADLSTSNQHAACLDVVSEPDPDSESSQNSDTDGNAIGVHEQAAGARHMRPEAAVEHVAASPHTLAVQKLQSQVSQLSTMLTKVMQFIDEHLVNPNALLNGVPSLAPPPLNPPCAPPPHRVVVPLPPPPPPPRPSDSCSVRRLPPPPAPPPRACQHSAPPVPHGPPTSRRGALSARRGSPRRSNSLSKGICSSCGNPAPYDCISNRCWACCASVGCPCHGTCTPRLPARIPPPPPPPPPTSRQCPSGSNRVADHWPRLHRHRGQRTVDASRGHGHDNRPPLQRFRPSGNGQGARR